MKQLIKKALKALGLYNVVRSYFIVKYQKWGNLHWATEARENVTFVEAEPKNGQWLATFEKTRYNWMKWFV